MSKTANLKISLLSASQAQKHVTVNEALVVLDAFCQAELVSISQTSPVPLPMEGQAYGIPLGASGDWADQDGRVAVFLNNGWIFCDPRPGWRVWVADVGRYALFDGVDWNIQAVACSEGGASTVVELIEFDHEISEGVANSTAVGIPASSLVFGVTGRVLDEVQGNLTSWKIGVSGGDDRYGNSLGLAKNSWAMGLSGQPLAYYSDTPLKLSAVGGTFSGGQVRLAIHLLRLGIPRAV
ncbi:DUF2793 domain-containing protein [Qingshengfaniella alkalisoli]|uniref:DUF2793 domain-containing protein n=1 Tax=Qingshengfaniella alkalisoli TaxID=2599296 RepID=A0A5B8J3R4_9RHOB|nr:DUF2793 domain-containing protein [Qingshengfaniella alkalisoli]QDY68930.1 DUF2793 domain-containing protein [Qingshengfaniella alkalisoli]